MRILIEHSNCGARYLFGNTYTSDHLDVGDEESLRTQGEQRVLQCIQQTSQEL